MLTVVLDCPHAMCRWTRKQRALRKYKLAPALTTLDALSSGRAFNVHVAPAFETGCRTLQARDASILVQVAARMAHYDVLWMTNRFGQEIARKEIDVSGTEGACLRFHPQEVLHMGETATLLALCAV